MRFNENLLLFLLKISNASPLSFSSVDRSSNYFVSQFAEILFHTSINANIEILTEINH